MELETAIDLASIQYGVDSEDQKFARVTFTVSSSHFRDFDLVCEVHKRETIEADAAAARQCVHQLIHDVYVQVATWA